MKKTIKILPNVNDIHFTGRLYYEPQFNEKKTVATLTVIRNFGGEKGTVTETFTMFKPKNGFPEFLKKGAPVEVHAYVNPNHWKNSQGQERDDIQFIVKTVASVELGENKVLPAGNNIDYAGRVYGNVTVTGNVARFSLIRNFGGGKGAAVLDFVMFKKEGESFPEILKSKAPIVAKAYFNPDTWTDSNDVKREEIQYVIKSVEEAKLVEKEIETEDASGEEGVDVSE